MQIDIDRDLQKKELHNKFKFRCVKRCRMCCSNNDIQLYPFDIMRLCNHLNITSMEFLKNHAELGVDSEGILRCYLKTKPVCSFFNKESDWNCTVYDHRPLPCRTYPVSRLVNVDGTIDYYLPKDTCPGFEHKTKHTIQSWIDDGAVQEFDSLVIQWTQFLAKIVNTPEYKLNDKFFVMFFEKIFYDFDSGLKKASKETDIDIAKEDYETRMRLAYELATIYLDNLDDWKEVYKRMDEQEQKKVK